MRDTTVHANNALIRGTTPTIEFVYTDISVGDIVKAVLTIKQDRRTIIEKSIEDATVSTNSVSWVLSQKDTLLLREKKDAHIMCDWKLNSGLRGRSVVLIADVEDSGKNEEI